MASSNGAAVYLLFERSLLEAGLTWEDIKENIPPHANLIGANFEAGDHNQLDPSNKTVFSSLTSFALWAARKCGLLRHDRTLLMSSVDVVNTITILLSQEMVRLIIKLNFCLSILPGLSSPTYELSGPD